MDTTRAREILRALADGRDPATGATFPPDSPYQQADTVRALYMALEVLAEPPGTKNQEPRTSGLPTGTAMDALSAVSAPPRDTNSLRPKSLQPSSGPTAGGRWSPDEEQRLRAAFAAQTPIPAIAAAHGRTRGAIASRLVKLGLLAPPDRPAGHLPPAHPPAPATQQPRPPNPTPDDDMPF